MPTKKKAPTKTFTMWRKSMFGGLIFGGIYTMLAYIFVSLAIDSGSLWQYLLAIVSLGLGIQSAVVAIKQKVHESK